MELFEHVSYRAFARSSFCVYWIGPLGIWPCLISIFSKYKGLEKLCGHGDGSDERTRWCMEATPKAVWITSPSAERCDPIALIKRKLFLYIWYFRTSWEWPTTHGEVWSIITAHADHACACMCVNMEHIAMVTTSACGIVRDGLISYVVLKPPGPLN